MLGFVVDIILIILSSRMIANPEKYKRLLAKTNLLKEETSKKIVEYVPVIVFIICTARIILLFFN